MNFEIEISKNSYLCKPSKDDIINMKFDKMSVDIDLLGYLIGQGYSYCSVMKNDYRNRDNFEHSNVITYDIDGSDIDMDACMDALAYKPSIAYTTPSNGLEGKGYRYRLIYCLDKPIESFQEYYNYTHSLSEEIGLVGVVGDCIDDRSYLCEQYWNGCYNCNIVINNLILNKENIIINKDYFKEYYKPTIHKSATQTITTKSSHYVVSCTFDENVKNDFLSMKYIDFIKKYSDIYENIEHTPMELDEDIQWIKYPENYYEIRRPWQRINGEVMKIRDGEGRRRKLFLNGIIRRLINPNITIDNMLYNIVYEFEYYYINNGNSIDKSSILSIVSRIMNEDIEKYKDYGKPRYKSFINPFYCKKYNLTKKQVMGQVRNKKQYIGEFYDFMKTDKENIETMKEYGLEISLRTLKTWKKENGIMKNKKRK